jgi:hypothetical protein
MTAAIRQRDRERSPRNIAQRGGEIEMTWSKDYTDDLIATPAQMERFGIDEKFDAVRSDSRNAPYLVRLPNPKDEEMAECWADAVYGAIAHDHGGFETPEDSEWCFEQCLINGRKYECEPEYEAIFEYMCGCIDTPPLKPPNKEYLH